MERLETRRNQLIGVLVDGVGDWDKYNQIIGELKAIDGLMREISDLADIAARME